MQKTINISTFQGVFNTKRIDKMFVVLILNMIFSLTNMNQGQTAAQTHPTFPLIVMQNAHVQHGTRCLLLCHMVNYP